MGKSNILKLIGVKAVEARKTNADTLGAMILATDPKTGKSFAESISPESLFGTLSSYLEYEAYEEDEDFKALVGNLQRIVLTKEDFKQVLHDEDTIVREVGLALVILGTRLMDLDNYAESAVNEKLNAGTLSEKDIEHLMAANISGLGDETLARIDEFLGKEDSDGCEECSTGDCKGCSCGGDAPKTVKVVDQKALVELIKADRISLATLKVLIESKEIDLTDLLKELGSDKFSEVITKIGGVVTKVAKTEGPSLEKATDMLRKVNMRTEDIIKEVMAETDLSFEEKLVRKNLVKNSLTDEEILYAINNDILNPYFLEGVMKPRDPKRFDDLAHEIVRQNTPAMIEQLKDPNSSLSEIIKMINKKK